MKSLIGKFFLVVVPVVFIIFKIIERRAYTPLPNGNFGEIYGPVSFFRVPVYVICACLLVVGLVLVLTKKR
jgi:hypothetical protein